MFSRRSNRTTRRLLKIVSLGIAGLLAGLFTGCSTPSNLFRLDSYAQTTDWKPNPAGLHQDHHLRTLDPTPIPSLKHPPVPHRTVNAGQVDTSPTLTNYAFVDGRSSPNSDPRQ
jgi:hypothetical protein